MDNMNKGIKFDFSKTEVITNKLRWIKTLKEVFCINLRDAKDAVDCGSYFYDLSRFSYKNDAINFYNAIVGKIARLMDEDCSDVIKFVWKKNESNSNSQNIQEINNNVVKVGSVYILTEEEYNHLCKCRGLLMDMLGTYKQFLQAYESFK
jgi:hypothetical protein